MIKKHIVKPNINNWVMLKSDFQLPKKFVLFPSMETLMGNDEKCFLFHLKSSVCSQDI